MTQTHTLPSQELSPRPDTNRERTQERPAEQPETGSGKVETYQSLLGEKKVRLGRKPHGPEVALEKVKVESVLGASINRVREVEHEKAEEAKGNFETGQDDAGEEVVEEQIEKSHTSGNVLKMWSEACERFQDVYAVKGNVDMAKFGHQVDVEGGQFVIPFTRREEMQGLLETASAGLGEAEGSFKIEHYNTLDEDTGFEAVYRYTLNGKPQEAKLTFFYYDDTEEAARIAEAQKAAEVASPEVKPEDKLKEVPKKQADEKPEAPGAQTPEEVQVSDMLAQKRKEKPEARETPEQTPAQKEDAPPVARDDEQNPQATVLHMQRNAANSTEATVPAAEQTPDTKAAA